MATALTLPRSAVLAAWIGAGGDTVAAVRAVQGDDEPHTVQVEGRTISLTEYLAPLLAAASGAPGPDVACVLPVPGDPVGLGPSVATHAIDAGEATLLRGADGCRALVPRVRRFGSALEPGHHVSWLVTPVLDWRRAVQAVIGSPREADRALQAGLAEATEALVQLDVARWSPVGEQVERVRDAALATHQLPSRLSGPRLRMLGTAARVRAIVALATADPVPSPSVFVADQRSTALREIDRAARRALSAATTFVATSPAP